jgi:hypothetical protein
VKKPTPEGTNHAHPDEYNVYACGKGKGEDYRQSGPDATRTPNLGDLLGATDAQEVAPDEEAVRRNRTACALGAGVTQKEFYLRLLGAPGKHGTCGRRSADLP